MGDAVGAWEMCFDSLSYSESIASIFFRVWAAWEQFLQPDAGTDWWGQAGAACLSRSEWPSKLDSSSWMQYLSLESSWQGSVFAEDGEEPALYKTTVSCGLKRELWNSFLEKRTRWQFLQTRMDMSEWGALFAEFLCTKHV